jgi:hypothetical protein
LNFFIESGLPFGIPSFQKIKEEKQEKCVKVDTKYNHYTRYKFIPTGGEWCSVHRPGILPPWVKKFHGYKGGMVPFENAGPFFLKNWTFRIL